MTTTVPVFPTLSGLAFPVKRKPVWTTVKADALSGKRTRYPNFTYPFFKYEISITALSAGGAIGALAAQGWQQLEGFIGLVQGPAQLFAFDDVNDDSVTNQLFGAGDGVTATFQLVRTLGGFTAPVFLINGTPSFAVGGVTTAGTVSPYGAVTFAAPPAPGALLTWTGMYYQPCRFDEDETGFSNFMSQLFELQKLSFSTEKLP